MAIPSDFSEVEHLQALIRRYINKEIRDNFRDLGDEYWEPEVITTRGAMRHALTHKDADPMQVTLARMFLYYFTYGRAQALQAPQYSIPALDYQSSHKYRPQIHLNFYQSRVAIGTDENGNSLNSEPVRGLISFRLMNEESTTITMTELERYANRIKTNFGANKGYSWHKGKTTVSYFEPEKGYRLKLHCRDKAEGKQLIEQVLDIQQHTPDWSKMTTIENEEPLERYPNIPSPSTIRVLGEQVKQPKLRPVVEVKYKYSTCHIHGVGHPKPLHDLTNTFRKTIAS